jgi:hypothetical protein
MVKAGFTVDHESQVRLFIKVYNAQGQLDVVYGPAREAMMNAYTESEWILPDTHSQPIAEIGIESSGSGSVNLDYLTWNGEPDVVLTRPTNLKAHRQSPQVWRQAWVDAMDMWDDWWPEPYRLIQNSGRGLIMQGTREWRDYEVEADITPWLMEAGGIAARVQGQRRFYGLQLGKGNTVRLIKALDGDAILAEMDFDWNIYETYALKMQVIGNRILGWVNGQLVFDVTDAGTALSGGGVAYLVDCGHISSQSMRVKPIAS